MTLTLRYARKIPHEEVKSLVIINQDVLIAGCNLVLQMDYTHKQEFANAVPFALSDQGG